MKRVKVTAVAVYITEIPARLMRRHESGDVAGSVKNAILKLETDAGIAGWGDAAPWAVFTGAIEAKAAMEMVPFDVVGPTSGLPVAELPGGRCRDDLPLSFSVAGPDCERDMAN